MAKVKKFKKGGKKPSLLDRAVAKMVSQLNLNTVILAVFGLIGTVITLWFNGKTNKAAEKQVVTETKVDSSTIKQIAWRKIATSRDSITRLNADTVKTNQDTIKEQNRLIISLLKSK